MEPIVRAAVDADLEQINEIYNSYIIDSHTSFDTEPWTIQQRREWFDKYRSGTGRYRVLVLQLDGDVVGLAASSPFKDRNAYDTSVETTIVLEAGSTGRGWGIDLFTELIEQLRSCGVHRAYALIALPNDPSIKLHARMGYKPVGTLNEVGHKLDRFHSVHIMELRF